MKKIFVVTGETGEFEDWLVWLVAAYFDLELATQRAVNAKQRANEIAAQLRACENDYQAEEVGGNEFDTEGPQKDDYDWRTTNYKVVDIDLCDG